MPYQLISTNGQVQYNINQYVVDTIAEINTLPKQRSIMGSLALCIENGEVYILNGQKEWVNFSNTSSGNGGTGVNGLSAYEIAVAHGFVGTEEEWLASLQSTNDYNDLINKPILNGEELAGEVEIPSISNENIDSLFNNGEG